MKFRYRKDQDTSILKDQYRQSDGKPKTKLGTSADRQISQMHRRLSNHRPKTQLSRAAQCRVKKRELRVVRSKSRLLNAKTERRLVDLTGLRLKTHPKSRCQ